ncbi:glycosyltransferase family 25 protein [Comamonas flocculans]|uniref:Glycosyltransferase family 25 protein n=1 Tax=Comamonas flocculans TaxID=2597701 RepID=A0A5B8RTQ0_9BURK|nr:glycosyltransferase family 25 protein [Comamonas flocculans]QEA12483.1 glycosyltransferase family 25 protein [Comamonas flocculans]
MMALSFFDNFGKIWIINLPHRVDRRREMERQLRRVGVLAHDPRITFFPAIRPDDAGGFPTIGTRGCFMSHLAVLREIQTSDAKFALILEDDCNFDLRAVNNLTNHILLKNTMMYGGVLNTVKSQPQGKEGFVAVGADMALMGAHCIAVEPKVAKDIADYFEKILRRPPGDPEGGPMHVDGAYSWYRKMHPERATVLAVPEIAYQRSSATDIHEGRSIRRSILPVPLISFLRKMKNTVRQVFR